MPGIYSCLITAIEGLDKKNTISFNIGSFKIGYLEICLRCGSSCDSWLAFKDDDAIGEICGHNKIMLDNESGLLCV